VNRAEENKKKREKRCQQKRSASANKKNAPLIIILNKKNDSILRSVADCLSSGNTFYQFCTHLVCVLPEITNIQTKDNEVINSARTLLLLSDFSHFGDPGAGNARAGRRTFASLSMRCVRYASRAQMKKLCICSSFATDV
jgi:hypothetical protein